MGPANQLCIACIFNLERSLCPAPLREATRVHGHGSRSREEDITRRGRLKFFFLPRVLWEMKLRSPSKSRDFAGIQERNKERVPDTSSLCRTRVGDNFVAAPPKIRHELAGLVFRVESAISNPPAPVATRALISIDNEDSDGRRGRGWKLSPGAGTAVFLSPLSLQFQQFISMKMPFSEALIIVTFMAGPGKREGAFY